MVSVCPFRGMGWWSCYIGMPLRYTGLCISRYLHACCMLRMMRVVYQYAYYGILIVEDHGSCMPVTFMACWSCYSGMPLRYTGLVIIRVFVYLLCVMEWWSCRIGMPVTDFGILDRWRHWYLYAHYVLWNDKADLSRTPLRCSGLMNSRVFVCLFYACFVCWDDEANVSVCLLRYTGLMKVMVCVCPLRSMDWCSGYISIPLRYTRVTDSRVFVCLFRFFGGMKLTYRYACYGMPVTVFWFDDVHGIRLHVTFYGMLELIYWYASMVYWIVDS